METIRNPASNPETRPETKPEYRERYPPDDRLARLHKALGGTALRDAGVQDPSRQAAAERVGPLAVRDQVALGNEPERDESQRDHRG